MINLNDHTLNVLGEPMIPLLRTKEFNKSIVTAFAKCDVNVLELIPLAFEKKIP